MEAYRAEGRGQLPGSFYIEMFFEGDFTLELAASGRAFGRTCASRVRRVVCMYKAARKKSRTLFSCLRLQSTCLKLQKHIAALKVFSSKASWNRGMGHEAFIAGTVAYGSLLVSLSVSSKAKA